MKSFTLPFILLISAFPARAQNVELSEDQLIKLAREYSPHLEALKATQLGAKRSQLATQSAYETRANFSYALSESQEDGLASFIPVFSPSRNLSLGVSKTTPWGVSVGAETYAEEISTRDNSIAQAARAGVKLKVEMDLLKNFLGRVDGPTLRNQRFLSQKAAITYDLEKHGFEQELRKLYWSLVATEMNLKLTEELVATAKKQLADAKQRARAGAADQGDVARNQALVLSRQSSVFNFKYQKEQLLFQIKQFVPSLKDKEIQIAKFDAEAKEKQALLCITQTLNNPQIDTNESDYFAILDLLKKLYKNEQSLANTQGDWDLKLQATLQNSGVQQKMDNAYDELQQAGKYGHSVGVQLSIPLDGTAAAGERAQTALVKAQYQAQISRLELQISETHRQFLQSLDLLQRGSRTQTQTVEHLQTSLKSSQKKYRQARISINELIAEQNNLFSSELEVIRSKLAVLHALYDYFKVFNKSKCSLNKNEG